MLGLEFQKRLRMSLLSHGGENKDGSIFCRDRVRFENTLSAGLFDVLWLTFCHESESWKKAIVQQASFLVTR